MRKSAITGVITAVLLCSSLQASAAVVTSTVGIELGRSLQTCTSAVALFTAEDCTVTGWPDLGLAFADTQVGPLAAGGYYATGLAPSPTTGSTPGDGKVNLRIIANITIDDAGTTGTTTDDLISFTMVVEGGVRNTFTSGASVNESFDSITHTLTNYLVDSASANGFGGFDYVIGSAGMMLDICTDDLPGQPGTGGCFGESEYGSSLTDGLSAGENVWTRPSVPGPWSPGYPLPGNVNYGANGVNNNVGAVVTSVIANYACVDTGGPDPDCAGIDGIGEDGAVTTWANSGAEWDNLIMTISTDAAGNVIDAKGYYVQMYDIILGGKNSWIGGSFRTVIPLPAAAWLFVSALALLGWMRRIAA